MDSPPLDGPGADCGAPRGRRRLPWSPGSAESPPHGLARRVGSRAVDEQDRAGRSEEHTSELQSRLHLVCRLLLEKKKKKQTHDRNIHETYYQLQRVSE